MKTIIALSLAASFFLVAAIPALSAPARPRTITILYDNRPFDPACKTDWGFSCLIEGFAQTVLFDVGEREDLFLKNVQALGVDLKKVDVVVISHFHSDHVGAIGAFFDLNRRAKIFVPDDPASGSLTGPFWEKAKKAGVTASAVPASREIFPGAVLTGTMGSGIKEQSLVLDTDDGLILVTGCSHPGIVNIVERAKSLKNKDLALVIGGFHLGSFPDASIKNIIAKFRENGVKKVGATHCTGDKAIQMMRDAYKEDFLEVGVGKKIILD
jgi:7,8-dihydropterin-6-yl-methyl-4-(beta-D-ribofuranosyl)aminobenzene 5'-phosphate synthase